MLAPPDPIARALAPQIGEFVRRVNAAAASVPAAVSVSSWWRSPSGNVSVGGALYSQHLLALAVDLVTPRPRALVAALADQGLHPIDEGDHVHVQAFPPGALPREVFARLAR